MIFQGYDDIDVRPIRGTGGAGSGSVTGSGTESPAFAGKDLREGTNITIRPAVLTSRHLYNLRNQSWSTPAATFDGNDSVSDLIAQFHSASGVYPSNADLTEPYIYPNTATEAGSKYIGRFNAKDAVNNNKGTSAAPIGYFIIDALDRGPSRKTAYAQMMSQYPSNTYQLQDLPADTSVSGPTCVCEYAGRLFYSGISGEVLFPDTSSPKLSSYVLFSQVVTDFSTIYSCYQVADPTSKDDAEIVDTDGGFIRVDGAYNITALLSIQSALVVLAENGVWVIKGGSDAGFTATNYKVIKVTNSGCYSPNSAVVVENAVLYCGKDGIFSLAANQYGDYVADNITKKTIQKFYNRISTEDLSNCVGVYDQFQQKVQWVFGNRLTSTSTTMELILDLNTGAYTKNTIHGVAGTRYPLLLGGVKTMPRDIGPEGDDITVETHYICLTANTPTIKLTFSNYTDEDHYDWKSYDGVGVDAKSFLLTGALSGNDTQRKKTMNYITAHFKKTEDSLSFDENGDLKLSNPSSCLFQAQWDWTDSPSSKKWSRKAQIYRLRRHYLPADGTKFDNGHYVVETKSKVRGDGKVVSFLFESEPGKHLKMYGWALSIGVDGNV